MNVKNHLPINYAFVKYAKTKSFCQKMVLKNILNHWNELKLYFYMTGEESGQKGKREAKIIIDTLNNQKIKLFRVAES